LAKVLKLRSEVTDQVIEKKLSVQKLLVHYTYYFDYYENLSVGRFQTAEQLYLSL